MGGVCVRGGVMVVRLGVMVGRAAGVVAILGAAPVGGVGWRAGGGRRGREVANGGSGGE